MSTQRVAPKLAPSEVKRRNCCAMQTLTPAYFSITLRTLPSSASILPPSLACPRAFRCPAARFSTLRFSRSCSISCSDSFGRFGLAAGSGAGAFFGAGAGWR